MLARGAVSMFGRVGSSSPHASTSIAIAAVLAKRQKVRFTVLCISFIGWMCDVRDAAPGQARASSMRLT
jgi:hypothetical protein